MTARRNRKLRRPLWARIPSPRALGRGVLNGLRPLLPVFVGLGVSAAIGAGAYLGYQWVTTSERFAIDRGDGAGLPVITGIPRARFIEDPAAVEAEIRRALAARAVYRNGARPRLGEIHVDDRRGITFLTYEDALAIRVGNGSSQTLARRLHTFDIAWASLEAETRAAAHVVYVDNTTRPDRVTVGFGDPGAN